MWVQDDGRPHPVAYASRTLSPQEKWYAITELETLAVVWAGNHFHAYLYGHDVVVFTDHSAVKAVLETPNPSGKHARWWSKVFGSGVRNINIVYRAGKENGNAQCDGMMVEHFNHTLKTILRKHAAKFGNQWD